jgi:hypothetical protein
MEVGGGGGGQHHALTALRPGKNRDFHWVGGGMDPRAGLDFIAWQKMSCPYRVSNPTPLNQKSAKKFLIYVYKGIVDCNQNHSFIQAVSVF